MSKRELPEFDFDGVANDNIDSNINDKNKMEMDIPENESEDILGDILEGKRNKKDTHTFKGYYLENRVANKIDSLTAGRTKGSKSELVNEILKKFFQEEGHL